MWRPNRTLLAIGVVIVAGVAILIFLHRNDWKTGQGGLLSALSPGGTQAYRQSYLNSSIASCSSGMASNPKIVAAKVPADTIANYCRCFAEKSVDQIAPGYMVQLALKRSVPPALNAQIQEDAKACAAQYLKHPS